MEQTFTSWVITEKFVPDQKQEKEKEKKRKGKEEKKNASGVFKYRTVYRIWIGILTENYFLPFSLTKQPVHIIWRKQIKV